MINRIFNRLQDHHDHQLRFLTKQIQQLETEQQQLESEQAKLALGQAKLSSEQEKLAAKQVKQQVENHHRRRQLQSYANNVRLIAQRAQILSHETQQALMKLAAAHEQLANSHEQLADSHQQLHQAHEQTSTTVANLVTKVSRLQQILEAVANTEVADLDVANSFKPETPSLDTVRLSNQQSRPTQLGFATITDDLPTVSEVLQVNNQVDNVSQIIEIQPVIDSATTSSSTVSNLPTSSDLPAVSRPASENDNENNFLPATKAPTKLLTKETPMLDATLNLDTTLNPTAVLNPNAVANDAEITAAPNISNISDSSNVSTDSNNFIDSSKLAAVAAPAKLRSRAFLKVAAAVLLGTLVVAPLAYYQFQPGGANSNGSQSNHSNNATVVTDLPDVTVEDGEKKPLTDTTITEIEKLVKGLEVEKAQVLLTPALQTAKANNDKIAEARLLDLQARIFSAKADFSRAIVTFKEALSIGQQTHNLNLLLGPAIGLVNIYHVTNRNAEAAKQARYTLETAKLANNLSYQAASLQMLGISELFAYQSPQAETFVEQSIKLAITTNNVNYLAQGYVYLGIIKTERKQFKEAAQWFQKGLSVVSTVSNRKSKALLESIVKGYYARSQALANNYTFALKLYQDAIVTGGEAGVEQYLVLSQLQKGVMACFSALGNEIEAAKALAKAEVFENEAYKRCELGNTFMGFAPVRTEAKPCD
jgi:tetratricopeptide (TPR) repeat protein